jgi:hypothetical protein
VPRPRGEQRCASPPIMVGNGIKEDERILWISIPRSLGYSHDSQILTAS